MKGVKLTKEQEILFEVYDKGVQNEDCDLDAYVEKMKQALSLAGVSKRFDFDKLLQDYRQEFVNGGGYVKSDTFESGTEPYEVFEWFKKKLS